MVIDCTIYQQTGDRYGDLRKTTGVTTTCWFRDIKNFEHTTNRDVDTSTSMAWLRATESVSKGDIMTILGNDYRVTEATFAKRLGSSDVQFIKCQLKLQGATVS